MTTQARAQVVVVLTAGWQVLCYDHNLRLMWSRRIKARQAGEGQMRGHVLYGSALNSPSRRARLQDPASRVAVLVQLRRRRRGGLRALGCPAAAALDCSIKCCLPIALICETSAA